METGLNLDFKKWNEIQQQIQPVQKSFYDEANGKFMANPNWFELHMEEALGRERLHAMEAVAEWNEAEREKRKAQFDAVVLDEIGRVTVEVCNTRKKYDPRVITNFYEPKLTIFENYTTEERMYKVSLAIEKAEVEIWFRKDELGDAKIMLKKFNRSGAEFLTNKNSERKNFILQLWTILMKTAKIVYLADRPGWVIMDKEVDFINKEILTWENIIKKN